MVNKLDILEFLRETEEVLKTVKDIRSDLNFDYHAFLLWSLNRKEKEERIQNGSE